MKINISPETSSKLPRQFSWFTDKLPDPEHHYTFVKFSNICLPELIILAINDVVNFTYFTSYGNYVYKLCEISDNK